MSLQLSFTRYITKFVQIEGNVFKDFNTIVRVYDNNGPDSLTVPKEILIPIRVLI